MGNIPVRQVFRSDPDIQVDLRPRHMMDQVRREMQGTLRWMLHPPRHTPGHSAGRAPDHQFRVQGPRGILRVSSWGSTDHPTILYVHGHGRSRYDAQHIVGQALGLGMAVVAPDCSGSGESPAPFVSWGLLESRDVEAVLEHTRGRVVALWGVDQGATACLRLPAALRERCAFVVAQDPFDSILNVYSDRMRSAGVSRWASRPLYSQLKRHVHDMCGFDLDEVTADTQGFDRAHILVSDCNDLVPAHCGERMHRAATGGRSSLHRYHGFRGAPPPADLVRRVLLEARNHRHPVRLTAPGPEHQPPAEKRDTDGGQAQG